MKSFLNRENRSLLLYWIRRSIAGVFLSGPRWFFLMIVARLFSSSYFSSFCHNFRISPAGLDAEGGYFFLHISQFFFQIPYFLIEFLKHFPSGLATLTLDRRHSGLKHFCSGVYCIDYRTLLRSQARLNYFVSN